MRVHIVNSSNTGLNTGGTKQSLTIYQKVTFCTSLTIPFPSIALHNTYCAFGSSSLHPYQRTLPKLTAQGKGRESGQRSLFSPSSNSSSLQLSASAVTENNSGVKQGTSSLGSEKSDNSVCLLHQLCLAVLLKETEKWKLKKTTEKII